jgi:hypothetical protein
MNVLRLLVSMLLALSTAVHASPLQISTMEVAGDAVHSVMVVPVAVLSSADDDGDGRLSPEELRTHRMHIDRLLKARFQLFNGEEPERIQQQNLHIPTLETAGGRDTDYLIMTRHSRWTRQVENLRADVDLVSTSGAASHMLLRAIKGSKVEHAVMHARHMQHVFFRGALSRVQTAVVTGARYLLREYDAVLVLLAILMAALGWRHLLRW